MLKYAVSWAYAIRGIAYVLRIPQGVCSPPQAYEGNYGWCCGYRWVILYHAYDSIRIREGPLLAAIVSRSHEPRQSASL